MMTRHRQLLLGAIVIAITAGGLIRRMTQPPTLTDEPASTRAVPAMRRNAVADRPIALISGFVRDDAGAPVAGARVCAGLWSIELPSDMVRDPLCTTSDVRGGYRIVPSLPSAIAVTAMAKGYEPATYQSPSGEYFVMTPGEQRHIDLAIHRGGAELSGTVTDIGGGAIAGAHVRARGLMAETDDHGHYSLWLSREWYGVTATAHGYASRSRSGDMPMHLDFTLEPGATLSGTVVDASGQPVEGVRVLATATDVAEIHDESESAYTDDRGRFSIDRLSPGHYIAVATAAHGYGTSEATLVGVGRVADTTVALAPAYQITAHLAAGTKRLPCHNSSALLYDETHDTSVALVEEPDGTLRADGVRPGTYHPGGSCANAVMDEAQAPIVVVDHDVESVWRVIETTQLHGHIRDDHGRPIAGAGVHAYQIDTPPRATVIAGIATATRDGEYVITGLPPGRYEASASAPGVCCWPNPHEVVELTATGATRDFVVSSDVASIHGVVTSHGRPAARVGVQVDGAHMGFGLVTDDRGAFEVGGVEPGHYTITVSNRAGALPITSGPHDIEVSAGASNRVALGVEIETGTIRGRVVEAGHPVSDAYVTFALEHDDEPGRDPGDREILAAADGTFVASELAAGLYSVRARHKGGAEVVQRHVALGASLVLDLPQAGTIAIRARFDGAPADELTVSLTTLDGTTARYEQRVGLTGEIALHDVSPGRYAVSARSHDAHARSEVTVVAGQVASVAFELEPRVTLVGRVVDARSGRPVPKMSISLSPETGAMAGPTMTNSYITDAAGRFEIRHVPRGPVVVTTQPPDVTMQATSTYRAIPHGGPAGEVIELGDIRVAPWPTTHGTAGVQLSVAESPRAPVIVSAVTEDGPAARAGLVVGDIVTAIDGIDVTGDHGGEATALLAGEPGAKIAVTVQRGVTATIVLD